MSGSHRLVSDYVSQRRFKAKRLQDADGARCILLFRLLHQPWQRDTREMAFGQEQRINNDMSRQQRRDCVVYGGRALDEPESDFRRAPFVSKPPRQPRHRHVIGIGSPLAVSGEQQPELATTRHQWLVSLERLILVPHVIFAELPHMERRFFERGWR